MLQPDVRSEQTPAARKGGRALVVFLFVLSFLCALSSACMFYVYAVNSADVFPTGTLLLSQPWAVDTALNVSGLAPAEAAAKLQEDVNAFLSAESISVHLQSSTYTLAPEELQLSCDVSDCVERAWNAYAGAGPFERAMNGLARRGQQLSYSVNWKVAQSSIREVADYIALSQSEPAVDAALTGWNLSGPAITPEKAGVMPDADAVYRSLVEYVSKCLFGTSLVVTDTKPIEPVVTADMIRGQLQDLSSAAIKKTAYSDKEQKALTAAVAQLQGAMLLPGQTLDARALLMTAGVDSGDAGAFTTALFQAAHAAGLDVQRSTASTPLANVDAGLEAVLYGASDVCTVANGASGPVAFTAAFQDGVLRVNVHGACILPEGVTRKLSAKVTATKSAPKTAETVKDPALFQGEEVVDRPAAKGQTVEVSTVDMQGERELTRTPFATVTYEPQAEVIRVGTKK